ncbi:ABC transporter substrate-binding protein [Leifsonia aquatica]|uniref:ABC transporter substrate-binding protein n=1 Tax=Leifsonia aquatica TaxID=144185 RepID=UPI0004687859|nr:extracellular solute-binding protein [Leifsonia aquatica]
MNRRKSLAVGIVAVAAALALSGCAVSGGGNTGGKTVLTLAWQSGTNTANDKIIAKFEKENPDVTVKLTTASDDDLQKTVRTQLLAGTAPDLLMVWPGSANVLSVGVLGPEGFLAGLDDIPWASKATQGALEASQADGKTYMATAAIDSSGAIYNMDTMKAVGLSVPTTWSQVLQLCSDARAKGKVAYGLGLQEGWTTRLIPSAIVANEIPDVSAFNKSLADGTFDFSTSAEWKTALEKQNEMVSAGCFNDSPVGTSMDNVVLPGVVKGDFLGTVSVGAHIGVMMDPKSGNPNAHFLMEPLPSSEDASASRINVLYNNGIGVNAKSKHLELAKKFVELWSSQWAVNLTATEKSLVPSIANDDFTAPSALSQVVEFTAHGRVAGGDWTPGAKTFSAMTDGVQGILLGKTTIPQALQGMQTAYLDGLSK